ncbi:MAG: class I SAM-dependent RNA methyltransferase [Candidatus Borkfalkiaceae bacterium]|nr:class I SAM-dependent RNA methyltransferase [Christensenellaceae bacterium]
MKICVTSASGIEAVTKRELYKIIGKEDLSAINGRIKFEGDESDVAKCNLNLRTGNRVEIVLGGFKAETFDDLFDGVKSIPFEEYIDRDGKIIVSAKSVQSKLFAYSAIQSVSKKAICERLCKKYGVNELNESGARYKIEVAALKDYVAVTLDTSGDGLHRRGYRGLVGEAPLKETLAAALVELSVWNKTRPFADLFCGTGTIPIEACMIALNIPAGLNRSFDFQNWKRFDKKIFDRAAEEAKANIVTYADLRISGFDIDDKQLKLARKHAELAGVDKYIHFQRADMRDFSSRFSHGVIISNPPYGERLSDRKEVEKLYRDYGKKVASLDDWCAYTLTPVDDFERLFGKKADKKRKIYNGKIECCYYSHLAPHPKKA